LNYSTHTYPDNLSCSAVRRHWGDAGLVGPTSYATPWVIRQLASMALA
jgi:hypothetical protein